MGGDGFFDAVELDQDGALCDALLIILGCAAASEEAAAVAGQRGSREPGIEARGVGGCKARRGRADASQGRGLTLGLFRGSPPPSAVAMPYDVEAFALARRNEEAGDMIEVCVVGGEIIIGQGSVARCIRALQTSSAERRGDEAHQRVEPPRTGGASIASKQPCPRESRERPRRRRARSTIWGVRVVRSRSERRRNRRQTSFFGRILFN